MDWLDTVQKKKTSGATSGGDWLNSVQSETKVTLTPTITKKTTVTPAKQTQQKSFLQKVGSGYIKVAEANRNLMWGKPTQQPVKKGSAISKLKKAFPGTTKQIQSLGKKAEPKNIVSNVWETIKQTAQEYLKRAREVKQIDKDTPRSEAIGKRISATTAGVGVLFTPINVALTAAEDIPGISKIAKGLMIPFMAVGEAADINANLVIDQLPISNEDKNNLRQPVGELAALVAQLALGKYAHIQTKRVTPLIKAVGKKTITKMTKEAIIDYKLSKTVTINGKLLRDIRNNGTITNAEIKDAFTSAKLTAKQQSDIFKGKTPAVDVKIPTSKVITLIDKPYWEKMKAVFNVKPSEPITLTIYNGESITVPHISGLLKAGEYTPNDIINKVATTALKNTTDGKKIVKLAVKAQETGGNVTVESLSTPGTTKVYRTAPTLEPGTQVFTNRKGAEAFATPQEPVREFTVKKSDITPAVIEEKAKAGIMEFKGEVAVQPTKKVAPKPEGESYSIKPKTEPDVIKGGMGDIKLKPYRDEITKSFNELARINPEIKGSNIKNIEVVGSYKTSRFKPKTSDIDFIVHTDKKLPSGADIDSIVDHVNSRLIKKFGEIPKGGKIEIIGVNDRTVFGKAPTVPQPPISDIKKVKPKLTKKVETKGKTPLRSEDLGFRPKNFSRPSSPKVTQEIKKVVKRSEIAEQLSKKLGVPIRRGKFRHAGAIGVYKPRPKVVRIKSGGTETVFHEVAHYLDDTIKFSESINITERKALMEEYGFKYKSSPRKQQKEAFAEFMRFRMTGQLERATKLAPQFTKVWEKRIKDLPEIKEVIDVATDDYKRWIEQPATAKILSHLSIGSQNNTRLGNRVAGSLHSLYTSGIDDLHPLSEFTGLAEKKIGGIPAEKNPYILARNLRGWVGKADLFLNKGTFGKDFWKKNKKGQIVMDYTGKSYSEIMKPIEQAGKLDDFRIYIVAQRIVNDLAPRGIESGISLKDAKTALKEIGEKNPEFEKVAEERRAYKDRLMEYAKDNGVIGEEGLKKIKKLNKFHVPFYRVMEESQTKFLGKTRLGGNIASPIKKIKGSEREIVDPLESDVKDTYAVINASERNRIGIAMANIAGKDHNVGRLFEEVVKPLAPIKVNVEEVLKKALKGTGMSTKAIPEDLGEMVVTLFKPLSDRGQNMLNVNFGDKQRVFQVDPDLFSAIQGLNIEDVGIIMRILSFPAKLLRAGATLSPDFAVRNPLRDQFTAMVYSRYGFIPGVDMIKGLFEVLTKSNVYNLWKAGGGEHSMLVSLDREILQKSFKEILSSNGARKLNYIRSPLKMLQIFSEFGEQATRLGEFRKGIRRRVDPTEVAFASREVTLDFARIGAKTRAMNGIIAFFNANVQGTDKMIRAFKTKPFRSLWKTFLGITLPSILLYFANRKDPRWKEIPRWQKDLFWIIFTEKHIYRIPKPFELGVIFGSVPERVLEYIDTQDPEIFKQLEESVANGFTPGYIPTALLPIIENISNYSFFLQRPIVFEGQQDLPPEAQAGTYTSEIAKVIGEALKYSPAKIDNLTFGYTGGLGRYAVSAMDRILEGTNVVNPPVAPAISLEDAPVIRAFMVRNPVGSGSESVNRIYSLYGKTSGQINYVKALVKDGKIEKAEKYVKAHPEVVNASVFSEVVMTFSKMNKAIREIRNSRELTAEQKRDKINEIGKIQTNIAQQVLEQIEGQK